MELCEPNSNCDFKSNYKAIYPPYGTMKDVENLIAELNKRDMHFVQDLVVNHTSDQVSISKREGKRTRSRALKVRPLIVPAA